ncbi:hypothetical protein D3C86_2084600 [compost metagenome]
MVLLVVGFVTGVFTLLTGLFTGLVTVLFTTGASSASFSSPVILVWSFWVFAATGLVFTSSVAAGSPGI